MKKDIIKFFSERDLGSLVVLFFLLPLYCSGDVSPSYSHKFRIGPLNGRIIGHKVVRFDLQFSTDSIPANQGAAKGQQLTPRILEHGYIFEKAGFETCHASTIVQLTGGALMAAWFGGKFEGSPDACIWNAVKTAAGWTPPQKIADGRQADGKIYACWNPVLFRSAGGKLCLYYKVGLNPGEWWTMYKVSVNSGKTWSDAARLPTGFLGPIKNKPIQIKGNTILYPSSTESPDEKTWAIHIESSDQDLMNWKQVSINCDTFQTIQPSILQYAGGRLQLLARSKQNFIVQSWSEDNGSSWSVVTRTDLPNPNSGSDAVTLPDHTQLLVYNPLPRGKDWWEGRSVLRLAASDDGLHWKDICTLENEKKGEYSYPAIICDQAGNIYITYTDNRTKISYVRLRLD